jgi:chemotaxis methyl-accepting protein methylase
MRATGAQTYAEYARVLDRDAGEYDQLLDALTINVTKLFRNWDVFATLARDVIPALWAAGGPVRVWSAGCASGEEAYSLAVLFHRHAAAHGDARPGARVSVLGTDIDRGSLAAAERGTYEGPAFEDTPADLRQAYFAALEPAAVLPPARALVRFARHDLLGDPPPAAGLQLIACRNVLIYFERATQEALLRAFFDALAPGGFLVLGKVETLLGAARGLFATVDPRARIFRRA